MEDPKIISKYPALSAITNKVAPSLIGCALGMFAASKIAKENRSKAAYGILAVGITAIAPLTYDVIRTVVNSPNSNIGRKKIIEGIRDGGIPYQEEYDNVTELAS